MLIYKCIKWAFVDLQYVDLFYKFGNIEVKRPYVHSKSNSLNGTSDTRTNNHRLKYSQTILRSTDHLIPVRPV